MNEPLRIAVADDEPDMRRYFQKALPRLGHRVVATAENGRQLIDLCLTAGPDLVITDIKMPEMDGIQAAHELYQRIAVPVILVSAYYDDELIERAGIDHIMGYLVKPIKQADLEPAILIAIRRFEQFGAVWKEKQYCNKHLRVSENLPSPLIAPSAISCPTGENGFSER